MNQFDSNRKPLMINDGVRMVRFYPDKVLYLRADGNYTEVYTAKDLREKALYTLSYKIGVVQEALTRWNFIRINRSELINADYVAQIRGYDITLTDGRRLQITQKFRNDVIARFEVMSIKREKLE